MQAVVDILGKYSNLDADFIVLPEIFICLYENAKFQYQADFLYGQRLDIYIPSIKAGIEYQGKQHYEAVDFSGSEEGLKDNKRRDEAKMRRCKMNGVRLFYWDFDKPLTDEYLESELMPLLKEGL